ncbi:MAG: helix-turn-helix domain-containing protein, partial [Microbacterium gubbeenense]
MSQLSHPFPSREGPVSVLDRVFAVLDVVRSCDGPISISGIAGEARIPKSTAARLVASLVAQRYLTHEPGGVVLGMRLF